jgi:hypothetical protein
MTVMELLAELQKVPEQCRDWEVLCCFDSGYGITGVKEIVVNFKDKEIHLNKSVDDE